ncbi:MAG: dTMP kinase [Desulfobacterales bacterium]
MFISLEGIEGSGKTTQIKRMVDYLESRGRPCMATREPGGTAIGRQIRAILLDPRNGALDAHAELLLYVADRVQHLGQTILPQLEAGRVVVCDRYFDATLVYQGHGRGLDRSLIESLHRLICANRNPDLTFLLDLEPEVGLARAWCQIRGGGRVDDETRFEQETLAFHQRIREGYLELASRQPQRFRIVNAMLDQTQVWHQIRAVLETALGLEEAP